jgi:microcystin-dependent protein
MTPGLLVYIPDGWGSGSTFNCVGEPPNATSVKLVNSGDPQNAPSGTLIGAGNQISPANLRGPVGPAGMQGNQGPPGPQGVGGVSVFSTLADPFTIPNTTGTAFLVAADAFAPGLIVYIQGGGYFAVQSVDLSTNSLVLVNQNYPGDAAPGTVVPAGNNVSGVGPQGPVGAVGPVGPAGPQGISGVMPTGFVMMYAAPTPPPGYLNCDGSAVLRTAFPNLFNIISTTFGPGDGVSTFNLPNYNNGFFPIGFSPTFPLGSTVGSPGYIGEATHALTITELAAHLHALTMNAHSHTAAESPHQHTAPVPYQQFAGTGGGQSNVGEPGDAHNITITTSAVAAAVTVNPATDSGTIGNTGGGAGHNNIPPYLAINFVIKT